MSRGGARIGAGRKPGSVNRATREARERAAAQGEMPLDYMLRVMRDESADPDRRDDMAKTAAPYLHGKIAAFIPATEGEAVLAQMLTGMRQSLAAKLDRIARARTTPPADDVDG